MFYDVTSQLKFESVNDFMLANAMTSYGNLSDPEYRQSIGLVTLVDDEPDYDPFTEKLMVGAIESDAGIWYQRWIAVPMTSQEIIDYKKALVPQAVTMRQARLALLNANKLSDVQVVINSLPEPQKTKAQIEWDYSQEVQRSNGFVAVIGPALGLTEDQIDDLFILAATL